MKTFWLVGALSLVFLAGPARADEEGDDEAMAVAQRYGLDAYERLDGLKFRYNLRAGTTTVARAWAWDAASGQVTLTEKQGRKTVTRSFDASSPAAADASLAALYRADHARLFFPQRIAPDHDVEIMFDDNEALPIPPGRAGRLTIDDSDGSGGIDARIVELYVDPDRFIRQWTLRSDWKSPPFETFAWEDHAKLGPLLVSLRRQSADGAREVWFSDVEAHLRGQETWVKPVRVEP